MGALTSKDWDAAHVGISLSEGQYFGDFDYSFYASEFILKDIDQVQPNGESAVVAMVEDKEDPGSYFCMASFRGRDLDETGLEDFTVPQSSYDSVFNQFEDNLKDIRDSSFTTSIADDDNPSASCDNMNDDLMAKFSSFDDSGLTESILSCLTECDKDMHGNTGDHCSLYIAGHSNGGVYAYAQAIKMQTALRDHFGDSTYDPTILTFGVPPAFDEITGCDALNSDKIFNFMNVQSQIDEYELEVPSPFAFLGADPVTTTVGLDTGSTTANKMDIAIGIGIGSGAAHIGRNVIISDKDPANCLVMSAASMTYPTTDYDLAWNADDVTEMTGHLASAYQDNLKTLAAIGGKPMERGFVDDMPCVFDEQCISFSCGSSKSSCQGN